MLRTMLLSPLVVIVAAAAGAGVCRAVGINPHFHELLIACGLAGLAATLGVFPILRLSHPSAAIGFQAAFLGSLLHLLLCLVGASAIILLRHPADAFVYWMLVLYWLTLFGMCWVFVSRLRAPAGPVGTLSH